MVVVEEGVQGFRQPGAEQRGTRVAECVQGASESWLRVLTPGAEKGARPRRGAEQGKGKQSKGGETRRGVLEGYRPFQKLG